MLLLISKLQIKICIKRLTGLNNSVFEPQTKSRFWSNQRILSLLVDKICFLLLFLFLTMESAKIAFRVAKYFFPLKVRYEKCWFEFKGSISDKYTPFQDSVIKRREKRQLEEVEMAGSSQENNSDFIPKNVFQKNQSPQLVKASWNRQIVYCRTGPVQELWRKSI